MKDKKVKHASENVLHKADERQKAKQARKSVLHEANEGQKS